MQVKVSLILPSLNVAPYIGECLESAAAQSLRELEILCVDAGSTDGTEQIIRDFAGQDKRIRLIHSPIKSYGCQVNIGLDQAAGEYVAILETDDFVHADMYGFLYEEAASGDLDQAAADYDTFRCLQSGVYHFERKRFFGGERTNWYGKILCPAQIATLRACDHVLWKGIYKKAFLDTHHIRLHETSGAAFQDMGFLQQIKTYVSTAKYLDKSFYRYRLDRKEASSADLRGLLCYEEEFRWLERILPQPLPGIHQAYYSVTMAVAFLTKYEQILTALKGDWEDERLSGPCSWFGARLLEFLQDGHITRELLGNVYWDRLHMLLFKERSAHASLVMSAQQEKERPLKELKRLCKDRPVVIFGCGRRGERLMLVCEEGNISIQAFLDNSPALQGRTWYGFDVYAPAYSGATKGESLILLSMKKGCDQARSQLLEAGVSRERIISTLPEELFG